MELPTMNERLLDEDVEGDSHWEPPVHNLDKFFTSMYNYHYSKGLLTILITQICNAISLGFTTFFSTFLIGFVDWNGLTSCRDESSCGPFSDYVIANPIQKFSLLRNLFTLVYCILLSIFWIWRMYHSLNSISQAFQMESFYRDKLGIRIQDIVEYSWDDVVQRLIRLHAHGVHRVAVKEKLTEDDIVLRIMRKENYMIGLINKEILDLRMPWWISQYTSERLFLTKTLEWSLNFCVMEFMFNDQFNISSLFLKDVLGLQGRFMMVGFIHLALLPFMIIFMIMSFFLQNASTFYTSKAYLGPRQWSSLALWKFREFNELPHIFESRMNKSYGPANEYLNLFHHINIAVVARSCAYISGALISFLLLISCFSEGAFLFIHIGERNLLFWLGILTAAYAGALSIIPDETKTKGDPEVLMKAVSAHTHHFPVKWENNCHTVTVHDEVSELFPYKVKVFALEVLSVVLTPLVLYFSLPQCAPSIIEFVREHTRYVEGVGAVCDYSLFDFERYSDEAFGSAASGFLDSSQRPNDGKLEKSFINFQTAHPHWNGGGEAGEALRGRLSAYRVTKENERMMHLSESLQRSLYPTGGQSMLGANILPKFSLEEDITTQYTEQLSPTVPINAYNNKPANGHMMKSNAVIHDSVLMTPTQTRTQPSTALSAGVGGVWTPQGYMKPSMNTPSTAAISVNAATPEPYEALPRNNITGNNNSHFISSAPRQIPGPRQVQSNPSAFVLPSRNRSDANISQSVGDINTVSSLLRSILKQENIDYENDFYWMQQFQKERERDPGAFEQSLAQSMLYSQTSLNPHSFMQRNNYPNRRVYESRGGMTSGHSHVDLDLSITDLGDHPVPSFTDTSQFSQVQPSHVLGTRALSQDSVTHSDIPRELHTTNDHVEIDSTSQNVSL